VPRYILIDFGQVDSDAVDRIRNFGEDLWGKFEQNGLASLNIDEVDRCTNRLSVVVNRSRYKTRALSVIKTTLARHLLVDAAELSEESGE